MVDQVNMDPVGSFIRWFWMSHGKDLLDVLTAAGTVAAAISAALAVKATRQVAQRQEKLSRDVAERQDTLMQRQLRQDLFEKRLRVYRLVQELIEELRALNPDVPPLVTLTK